MTKTIEELKQRAKEVAELDRKRTQDATDLVLGRDTSLRIRGQDYYQSLSEEDRVFLCFSHAMAQLIADQHAKIEEMENALKLISNPPDRRYVSDYDIANSMVGIAINVLK